MTHMPTRHSTDSLIVNLRKRMTSLGSIVNLDSTMDFNEVLTLAVERISHVIYAERTSLFLMESDESLVSRVLQGETIAELRIHAGEGLVGWTARHKVPLIVPDAYADERFDRRVDRETGFRTRDVMCYPVFGRTGNILGVVETMGSKNGGFNEADLLILGAAASQLSMIIENARTIVDLATKNRLITEAKLSLESHNRELQVLLELEKIVARSDTLDALGKQGFEKILAIMDGELGSLYLVENGDATKRIYSADNNQQRIFHVETGTGFTGWVASRNTELNIKEPATDPRYEHSIHRKAGVPIRNLIACPLPFTDRDGKVGAIMVCNKRGQRCFDSSDQLMLQLIASQTATAIDRLLERDQREREHRLATVGRLLAGVLHDLKTPITTISGYAELMAETTDMAENREHLTHIKTALSRMKTMTADIISFSRGENKFIKITCMIDALMDSYRRQMADYVASHNVELVIRQRTGGAISVDPEKLLRAFHNITINAVEAMQGTGRLIVEVDRLEESVVFSFTDTGKGVPPEIQGKLFNSFVSFGKHEGTGLGLAVAKEIVTGHDGHISFTSFKGSGTTFLITLPG